jgi:hypothetical protein
MPSRLATSIVVLALASGPSLSAQTKPTVEQLLERMASYLANYELLLSSVVADERFEQRVVFTRAYRNGQPVLSDERRRIESEIGFLRLPGGVDWLGFREVQKINGKLLREKPRSLSDLLDSAKDTLNQARAIADASAEHNMGVPRSTNVPTAPLEIIHPRNYKAHQFTLRGDDTIKRTRVMVLGFNETRRPPLVQGVGGQELVSRGRIWLEPDSGTIWRVEWIYAPAIGSPMSLKVEFARDDKLNMMVPVEMREEFPSMGGLNSRGDGVAYYSNYRKFGTGARIVQQPFEFAEGRR